MEELNKKISGLYEYLDLFRKRLLSLAVIFFVAFVAGFLESGHILRAIIGAFDLRSATIVTTAPFQFLDLATKIGFFTGFFVCLPVAIYYLYSFLKDGLNRKEKRLFFVLLPIGACLFVMGFVYSYMILLFYLNSVSTINLSLGMNNMWDISSFMSQVILASVLLGLIFEFPIILTFLIQAGFVDVKVLKSKRIYAVCAIFIFVGFLPPPDVFSTILQVLPLVAIYEITLGINSAFMDKRSRVIEAAPAMNEATTTV